ncbi:hypothetical protein FZC66_07055 [Priestia megaterium]|nr:hypothetical protein FZC66_07055 [Priestia megaterium]
MPIDATLLFTLSSFVGLLAGGGFIKLFNSLVHNKLHYMYAVCGGILLGLLAFEILPSVLADYDLKGIVLGTAAGYLAMLMIDAVLHSKINHTSSKQALALLIIALLFHNIITGMTFGSTGIHESPSVFAAAVLHQVPEGIAIMTLLSMAKIGEWLFLFVIFLLSFTLGVSLLIGEIAQASSFKLQALLTGGAIGTLFFVVFHEVIGKSTVHFQKQHVWILVGIGVLLIYVYEQSFPLFHNH